MIKRIISIMLISVAVFGGERINGIYLGEDVGAIKGPMDIAVQIDYTGTVTVWIGAKVPIHDPEGRDVFVRKVVQKRAAHE